MKELIFSFCIIFTFILKAQNSGIDVPLVIQNMRAQEEAWNGGDLNGFMAHYWKSDSLKFIGSKGITYGWQKTLDNYLKAYPTNEAMGALTFTLVEATQLSESSIYIIGKWALLKDKPVSGYFTLLWKKVNNRWVIVSDHTS